VSDVVKKDVFGKILENMVNSRPFEAGIRRQASYCAHEGTIYVAHEQANRNEILRNNAKMRKERKAIDGGVMLTIPEAEYAQLVKHPEWGNPDFMRALMKKYPEYISSG